MAHANNIFTTITIEGALLPPDILQRIMDGDTDLGGLHPEDYHLYGERLNEATNRAWTRLQGAWQAFKHAQDRLPEGDIGTRITRERWLMVLFNALDYGRLEPTPALEIDGKSYAISHRYKNVPIHLLGYTIELDKRTRGVSGAATASPHSMMQVFLNRMDDHLWGIVSNGYRLRLLRDNISLTRQAYIEFDLQSMMDGDVYSDFVLLYLLCHQSRIEADNPNAYWLEKWRNAAEEQGKRALDELRNGVEKAINCLGEGFIDHPHNTALRDALTDGQLDKQDYYRQLLRLVYRMLFMFVAEDRDLLHAHDTSDEKRALYQHYSTDKLRDLSANLRGTRHHDLYESLRLVMRLLGAQQDGADQLGLPVLGSMLFSDDAVKDVIHAKITNRDLLDAVRAISTVHDHDIQRLRRVDFKNLGSEELGSVYESLLELHPEINLTARTFELKTAGGNERKTTGSYYTPTALIGSLLDSALDPVLEDAARQGETAILELKVCDPACGSGHFLIAAANRIAKRLAQVRTSEDEPTPDHIARAKRDVISHCIYGVDINPMAVELCKVNLWLESIDPGKPLSFLDHRIQVGNSLLGTTPKLMADGIPDDAFVAITGDDKKFVSSMKRVNKEERKQRTVGVKQFGLFDNQKTADYTYLSSAMNALDQTPDDTLMGVRRKEQQYTQLANNPEYIKARLLADAWCAAFVWEKRQANDLQLPMTDLLYRRMESDPLADNLQTIRETVVNLTNRYGFFHWHVAFPDVFSVPDDVTQADNETTGWNGGFDVVLGNPPWEHTELKEQEWFAERAPEIADASGAKRKKLIANLESTNPQLYTEFVQDKRQADGFSHFVRKSQNYVLTGRGRINTYAIFAETTRHIVNGYGRVGIIIPSGIATDDTTKYFFQDLMQTQSLVSLYDFENSQGIFQGVHRSYKFCLLTLTNWHAVAPQAEFAFFAQKTTELQDDWRRFTLSGEDIALLNPNTGTVATFRSQRDADLTKTIYRYVPILIQEDPSINPWGITFKQGLFNMTSDSDKFYSMDELSAHGYTLEGNHFVKGDSRYVPLYEAKMMHQFTHRWGTYQRDGKIHDMTTEDLLNPSALPMPRYWVDSKEVQAKTEDWNHDWLLGFRNNARTTDMRTAIFGLIPRVAVGHNKPLWFSDTEITTYTGIYSNTTAFIYDFVVRQKVGGASLGFFIVKQLPVIPPHSYTPSLLDFIVPRVLELTYTAWDLQGFAQDVGYDGAPFVWDEDRRFLMRCELDALYFHLYQIAREDVDYIMETFPIVKRKDEAAHGHYRTKETILEMYDQMANLPRMSVPTPKDETLMYDVPDVQQWDTWLNPAPADSSVAHQA